MGTIQNAAVIPVAIILSEIEKELKTYASYGESVNGDVIVSAFDSVVRINHRLPIDSLPGKVQNLYWDARRRPDIRHKLTDLSAKLRELCGVK